MTHSVLYGDTKNEWGTTMNKIAEFLEEAPAHIVWRAIAVLLVVFWAGVVACFI